MTADEPHMAEPDPAAPPPPYTRPGSRYLLPSERTVVSVRRHWALLIPAGALALGGLFAAGWITGIIGRGPLDDLLWLGALALLGRFVWKTLEWQVDRFIVTDKRMLLTSGLLTRKVAMMPLIKVTDMSYERSPLGRIFGFGTFVMESAGHDQALRRVEHLPSPDQLYLRVADELFGPRARTEVVYDPFRIDPTRLL